MAQDVRSKVSCNPNSREYLNWMIRLTRVPGFGAAAFSKVKGALNGELGELFTLNRSALIKCGFSQQQCDAIVNVPINQIDAAQQWACADSAHTILHYDHPSYPEILREIGSAPLVLYCRGDIGLLHSAQIAMVGSRNPTHNGKSLARSISSDLTSAGWTITSGLALGIDAASHQGALDNNGKTVAVLGTGIDILYPKRNNQLAMQILAGGGCIISEFAPGVPPRPENFPRRNRIISGLSKGTLVVEAAIKSGSLISARYALEQNREVFALPGNVNSPLAKGCHYLIKQGAKLVETAQDINEEFQNLSFLQDCGEEKNLQKKYRQSLATDQLLDSVDYDVTAVDVVARRSNMSISDVLAQLLQYELRGLVTAVPGGYIKLGGK